MYQWHYTNIYKDFETTSTNYSCWDSNPDLWGENPLSWPLDDKNYNEPAKEETNFFLLITLTAGPITSLPLEDNLFFNKITLFSLKLKVVPSLLLTINFVLTRIPFNFVFFLIQLLGTVFCTLHFIKSPT